jgi:hypothetical protein
MIFRIILTLLNETNSAGFVDFATTPVMNPPYTPRFGRAVSTAPAEVIPTRQSKKVRIAKLAEANERYYGSYRTLP